MADQDNNRKSVRISVAEQDNSNRKSYRMSMAEQDGKRKSVRISVDHFDPEGVRDLSEALSRTSPRLRNDRLDRTPSPEGPTLRNVRSDRTLSLEGPRLRNVRSDRTLTLQEPFSLEDTLREVLDRYGNPPSSDFPLFDDVG